VLKKEGATLVNIDASEHRELIGNEESSALLSEFKAAISDYLEHFHDERNRRGIPKTIIV
jgi:hypothetical protein